MFAEHATVSILVMLDLDTKCDTLFPGMYMYVAIEVHVTKGLSTLGTI